MILIVDDDPSITASLALLLKQHGHRSASAHSVDEALGAIRSERPSLEERGSFDLVHMQTGRDEVKSLGASVASRSASAPCQC